MNNWNFTGNLGHSAEQKDVGGTSLVTFSVAVKAGYGKNETTTWARCNMWGTRGEAVLPFLKKGQLVGICGEVSLHEWAGKDGTAKAGIEVRVNDLTLLGKRDDAAPVTEHSAAKANAYQKQPIDGDEDIPFLFNMNSVSDIIGTPNSLWRSQRGKNGKEMLLLRANKTDF